MPDAPLSSLRRHQVQLENLDAHAKKTIPFADAQYPMSRPGCWAYPDMLEVGVKGQNGKSEGGLSWIEQRTHFGLWCVLSSPLTLSFDLSNSTLMDKVWSVISNPEALSVSQSFYGHPGTLVEDEDKAGQAWQVWAKPQANGAVAVLLISRADSKLPQKPLDLSIRLADHIAGPAHVRDVWNRKDLGTRTGVMSFPQVEAHDSVFLVLTPTPTPSPHPTPSPTPTPTPAKSQLVNPGSSKCLDINGGSPGTKYPANYAQAQLYRCHGADNQEWMLQGNAIVNPASGKCLDIYNHLDPGPDALEDGRKVELFSCNGKWNQQFELRNGQIVNTPSGKCVDIDADTYPNDKSRAQMSSCGGTAKQAWEFKSVASVVV